MLNTDIDLPSRHTSQAPYSGALNKFLSDLDWRTVHALFDHQDFNPSYRWIAIKSGCTVEKVSDIIEGFISLGVIKRTEDGFELLKKDFDFNELGQFSREMRIDSHILLSQQISQKRDYSKTGMDRVAFVASNKSLVTELHEKISAAVIEFRNKSLQAKKDGVYGLAVIGTDLIAGEEK